MIFIHNGKKILTVLIMLLILWGMAAGRPPEVLKDCGEVLTVRFIGRNRTVGTENIQRINQGLMENLPFKEKLLAINGLMGRCLCMREFYAAEGIYIAEGNYIVSVYEKTDVDYEVDQVTQLQQYLEERGIPMLYVNAPIKYDKDSFIEKEFGLKSYGNQNADLLLQQLEEKGVSCVDLRKIWTDGQRDITEMFYRTDHHWTVEAGLWAAGTISKILNERAGRIIDLSRLSPDHFTYRQFRSCWLGEQGQKVSSSYVGFDDFVVIKPDYPTHLKVDYYWGTEEGDFSVLLDESIYQQLTDEYNMTSWHYSYMSKGLNGSVIHNQDVKGGRILVLGDSYSQVFVPFLVMGVEEVSTLVLRGYEGDLLQLIEENQYDAVIILYASFMIGAHNDTASSNCEMFHFIR